jgi:hypothetical protein
VCARGATWSDKAIGGRRTQMQARTDSLRRQNEDLEQERQKVAPARAACLSPISRTPLRLSACFHEACAHMPCLPRWGPSPQARPCPPTLPRPTRALPRRHGQLIQDNERLAAILNQDPAQEAALLQVHPPSPSPSHLRPWLSRTFPLSCLFLAPAVAVSTRVSWRAPPPYGGRQLVCAPTCVCANLCVRQVVSAPQPVRRLKLQARRASLPT